MSKRSASPTKVGPSIAPKRARAHTPPPAANLDSWLKPDATPPLLASSPHLHASTSTFVAFTLSFEAPPNVRTEDALRKEAKRIVAGLNVVQLVGAELLEREEGAFQHGEGRAPGRMGKGKERAREPDCRMWAIRTLGLAEGKDGTGGEGDYQLLESFDDDGEKYGGERILRVLKDQGAVDVITICCRWFGGDLLGPARFSHIGITAGDSAKALVGMVQRRDLRAALMALDEEISGMRATLAADLSQPAPSSQGAAPATYEDIDDVPRLERLVKAREMTKENLEKRVGWVGLEQARGAGQDGP